MFRAIVGLMLAVTVIAIGFQLRVARSVRDRTPVAGWLVAHDSESWNRLQRIYPTGRMPAAGTLERAALAARGLRVPADRAGGGLRPTLMLPGEQWVPVGPQPIITPNRPYSGRVTAVAPHPSDGATIYLGTDSGGVWRSIDAGATWTPLTDAIPVPAIQSLTIDRADPRLLYASTIQRTYGTRWLRSINGGESWSVTSITTADGRVLEPARCAINVFKACIPPSSGRIIIDPARAGSETASRIYFAGLSHLLRSDNSGGTFDPVLSLDVDLDFSAGAPARNPEAEVIRDVALDPARPERILVVTVTPRCLSASCDPTDAEVAVYRTDDGGGSWTRQPVVTLAPFTLENTRYADPGAVYVPRVRIDISPANPDVAAIAIRDIQANRPRVFRSTDNGETWGETSPAANTITWPLDLTFSPDDPNTMYVASSGVYRTTNGGQTWVAMQGTHVDNIDLTFDASGRLVVGNDGGIFRSTTGTALEDLNGALPITEFYSVAAHPTNPLLLAGGTQDNGTLVYQGTLGWSRIVGGDGGDTLFDPGPAPVLYGEVEWFFIGDRNVFFFFRCEPGNCFDKTAGIDLSLDGPFIPKFGMAPASPSTLWLTAERMFRTDNRGDSWSAASPSVGALERCWTDPALGRQCAPARYFTAVAVATTASQTVYGGTLNGDVRRTDNNGASWRSLAGTEAGPLPVRAINDIVIDPFNQDVAYVAYSGFNSAGSGTGHVFRTADGGVTWQDVSSDLPDVPVNALLIDPDSTGTGATHVIYAATDVGVFRATMNGSPSWAPFGTGMPPVIVNDLAYNATTRQLLAATYGRGIYAISSRFAR